MTDLADYTWLASAAGERWLREAADHEGSSLQLAERLRRDLSAQRARLIASQASLRKRGVEKFGRWAAKMFFERVLLEQATDLWIARYKASRYEGAVRVVDLCTGMGGDLMGLAEHHTATGWDRRDEACWLAKYNAELFRHGAGDASKVQVHVGDVGDYASSPNEAWHVDPDRRATGQRRTRPEFFSPRLEQIDLWREFGARGAVKLAPGTQPPATWEAQAEWEWISRDRQCRQLVAWFAAPGASAGQHRATHVTPVDGGGGFRVESFAGDWRLAPPASQQVGAYIFDADAAIHAAGLLGAAAGHWELTTVGVGGGYLTADAPIDSALLANFAVEATLPLRERQLADYCRSRKLGALEIKTRGVDVDPNKFRRRLKLTGDNQAVLLLTRVGPRRIGVFARRVNSPTDLNDGGRAG